MLPNLPNHWWTIGKVSSECRLGMILVFKTYIAFTLGNSIENSRTIFDPKHATHHQDIKNWNNETRKISFCSPGSTKRNMEIVLMAGHFYALKSPPAIPWPLGVSSASSISWCDSIRMRPDPLVLWADPHQVLLRILQRVGQHRQQNANRRLIYQLGFAWDKTPGKNWPNHSQMAD